MCKPKAPHSYGFTTTPEDNFFLRVAREAKKTDNFLVSTVKNTHTGSQQVVVLIRESALPPKNAGFALFDAPLTPRFGRKVLSTEFRVQPFDAVDASKAANIVKSEIQKVKNFLLGRTQRVVVEAL